MLLAPPREPRFQVSWPTVKRWVDRYLAGESMQDRSSRPRSSPNKTNRSTTKRCISLRMRLREGPVQLAARLGIAPSTVHRILRSARLNRFSHIDRATGEPIRRYEHPYPGSLIHVDVKKVGNIPDGGGWRFVGRSRGQKSRASTPDKPTNKWHGPKMGYAFVPTVIDDHSRVACAEEHDDETAVTAAGVLHGAVEWFADRGVTVERGAFRQCERLPVSPVARRLRQTRHQAEADSPVPPADQRQGRTLPPHWPTGGHMPTAIGQNSSAERP